jgi:peptide/nickel transport system substrate-binding protein
MPNAWLERARRWWRKVFFWHANTTGSHEVKPHVHHDHALVVAVTEPKRLPGLRQLKFLPRLLTPRERRIVLASLALAVLGLGLGLTSLLRNNLVRVPATGGTITEALVGSPKLLNPLFAPLNDVDRDLTTLIYSGLFRLDDQLVPQPDLAESYQWSDDGKTLDISLRRDVTFHDGQPLTAHDVAFTFEAVRNPAWRSPLAQAFHGVHVVRIEDHKVQFQLDKAQPDFLAELTLGILPAHLWEDVPDSGAALADANVKPIGSGPYQVESFTRDSKGLIISYHLMRFPRYYGLRPYLDSWRFRFFPDRTQAEAALKANQVDALAFMPWREAESLAGESFHRLRLELPQETVAFFNVRHPLLKDEKFRRALALAIDRGELVAQIGNGVEAVNGPFPFLDAPTSSAVNLDEARSLLTSLGWVLPEGENVRIKSGSSTTTSSSQLEIVVDVPEQQDLLKVAETLKRRWSLLGIRVEVRPQDAERLLREAVTSRSYQVIIWNLLIPPRQDLSPFWASASVNENGLNLSNLADRNIDTSLEAARSATSSEAQITARRALAETITKTSAALFLLRPSYAYVVSRHIQGTNDLRLSRPSDRFLWATQWYVKTAWSWK